MKSPGRWVRMAAVVIQVVWLGLVVAPGPVMADGAYSRYDFTFFIYGGADQYQGYVFAPTGFVTVGQNLYYEPQEMGGFSLDGGYYHITAATAGYGAYDKQSYITSYYDPNLNSWLGVNSDASSTAGSIYVANRSLAHESGYALSNGQPGYFDPFIDTGSYGYYTCYRINLYFYYNDGSGDYYYGYVYLTDSSMPNNIPGYSYNQPNQMGGGSVSGYYYFYNYSSGYAMSYNKKAYVTSYYDASIGAWLGVNGNGSTTADNVYVADRLANYEKGYAIYGSQVRYFDCYSSASF